MNDFSELKIELIGRRWKCSSNECNYTCTDSFQFIEPNKKNTKLVPLMILRDMKDIHLTCREIAARYHVSDTYVHYTFLQYVSLPRKPLTCTVAVDEVHLNIASGSKYALVIMDFITGDILDIVESRREDHTHRYFKDIPKKERDGVKFLISDMYKPYTNYIYKYFNNAVSIVDSFHVIKWINDSIGVYINDVKKKYQARDRKALEDNNYANNRDYKTKKDSDEVYILKHAKWVLLMNKDNITYYEKRYNRFLNEYLDTYDWQNKFLALDDKFPRIKELKDLYEEFNGSFINDVEGASKHLDELIEIYKNCELAMFKGFSELLEKFRVNIINSFNYVTSDEKKMRHSKLRRLSNGPLESFNNVPSSYRTQSHGVDNFQFTRNRILWSERDDAGILGTPKTKKEVQTKTTIKRGPYKKKNKK